jgi:hypothetical protein
MAQQATNSNRTGATLTIQIAVKPTLFSPSISSKQDSGGAVMFHFPERYKLTSRRDEEPIVSATIVRGRNGKHVGLLRTVTYVIE